MQAFVIHRFLLLIRILLNNKMNTENNNQGQSQQNQQEQRPQPSQPATPPSPLRDTTTYTERGMDIGKVVRK